MSAGKAVSIVIAAIGGLLVLMVLFGSWFTVDQGARGVVLRNGAFVRVAEPGLGIKVPFIEAVVDLSIRTEKTVYEKVSAYSKDIQYADLQIAINHRLDPGMVAQVYQNYGISYVYRLLTPQVLGQSKVIFGKFNAKSAIEQRGQLQLDMEGALQEAVKGTGLIVESVQIENIDFSDDFEKSIEERMKAEVEVAKLHQNLAREQVQADIVRTQANGRADAVRAQAKADADAIRMRGEAEATAILARAEALKQNMNLVELVKAERWDGKLPVTMLPDSAVPFIGVK